LGQFPFDRKSDVLIGGGIRVVNIRILSTVIPAVFAETVNTVAPNGPFIPDKAPAGITRIGGNRRQESGDQFGKPIGKGAPGEMIPFHGNGRLGQPIPGKRLGFYE